MQPTPKSAQVFGLLLLACGIAATPAHAAPLYSLDTTIPIPPDPAVNPSGQFTSFDISFFDDSTQLDYVADRNNASVDVFSAATNSFVTRVPGFVGLQATTSVSGPDGVLTVNLPGQHQLWAGDGNSTLKGFDISNGNAPLPFNPIATGTPADKRVDEMAFEPRDNRLLVANNAATPPFSTVVDARTGTILAKTVSME